MSKTHNTIKSSTDLLIAKLSKNQNILNLLARYGMLETFLVEILKDEKNKNIALSRQRQEKLLQDFKFSNEIDNDIKMEKYCKTHLLSKDDLKYLIEKEERSKNYSNKYFSSETQTPSKKKKTELVSYSLLRVSEEGLANELYLQITEEDVNFKELINKYSEGPEKKTNGIIGPSPISKTHPILLQKLRLAKQGQLIKPFKIENWWLIVRLESFVTNFDNGFIIEDQSYALYKDWLLGEAVKILSSLKSDESDQECWSLGDISL